MKNLLVIIFLFLLNTCSINHFADSIMNNFTRIDSLNLYRKDRNTEVLTIMIKEDLKKVLPLVDWQRASERGLIINLKRDFLKSENDSKKFIFEFDENIYKRNKILYYGKKSETLIIFARFYKEDSVLSKSIDSLFRSFDLKAKIIKANYLSYDRLQDLLTDFAFKPFMWSEKIRMEYITKLKNNKFIEGSEMRSIFDSYQIASGHNTGVGQLLAIRDFLRSGHTLLIKNWSWDTDVNISNLEQLQGFIQSYDPVIDILNGEEFKN